MYSVASNLELTVEKTSINKHFGQKSLAVELDEKPVGDHAILTRINPETGALVVGYLTNDCNASWEGWPINATVDTEPGLEGLLLEFTSEVSRDEAMTELRDKGLKAYVVERFKHSDVQYSIAGTQDYPYAEFDVAPSGVYVLDDVTSDLLDDGQITEEQAKKIANQALKDYSSYCNGECFMAVVEEFKNDGGSKWRRVGHDQMSNLIGYDSAMGTLKNDLMQHTIHPAEVSQKSGMMNYS